MKKFLIVTVIIIVLQASFNSVEAQSITGSNVVATAVPFLLIAPDSRGAALGETGVATSPDINSQYWNQAKYPFVNQKMGASLTYTPWMRSVVSDMNFSTLSGFLRISNYGSLSSSMRYLSYGSLPDYNTQGILQSYQRPKEFAFDVGYSTKFSRFCSGGVALRYILSDMARGEVDGIILNPAKSFAADVSFYYSKTIKNGFHHKTWSLGAVLSNIGSPISYNDGLTKNYLPANLRIGGGFSFSLDRFNEINLSVDLCKLMVPSTTYTSQTNSDGELVVTLDDDAQRGVFGSMIQSFSDAPGGFAEEFQEINAGIGAEYVYNKVFAIRTGFFNENENKGARKYASAGVGIVLYSFSFDLSYLYSLKVSPLENTMRFTVSFDFSEWFKNSNIKR